MKVGKAIGTLAVAGVVVGGVVCGGMYYSQLADTGAPTDPFTEEVLKSEAHETDTLTDGAIDRAVTNDG